MNFENNPTRRMRRLADPVLEYDDIDTIDITGTLYHSDLTADNVKFTTEKPRRFPTDTTRWTGYTLMSNPNTKAYLGGFWGDTHHFTGFLYKFEYAILGEPEGGNGLPDLNACETLINTS